MYLKILHVHFHGKAMLYIKISEFAEALVDPVLQTFCKLDQAGKLFFPYCRYRKQNTISTEIHIAVCRNIRNTRNILSGNTSSA